MGCGFRSTLNGEAGKIENSDPGGILPKFLVLIVPLIQETATLKALAQFVYLKPDEISLN